MSGVLLTSQTPPPVSWRQTADLPGRVDSVENSRCFERQAASTLSMWAHQHASTEILTGYFTPPPKIHSSLSDLRNQPYRRADAVRRSVRRRYDDQNLRPLNNGEVVVWRGSSACAGVCVCVCVCVWGGGGGWRWEGETGGSMTRERWRSVANIEIIVCVYIYIYKYIHIYMMWLYDAVV